MKQLVIIIDVAVAAIAAGLGVYVCMNQQIIVEEKKISQAEQCTGIN